jgi:hypothetical protein
MIIRAMMEAVRTSETSVNFNVTTRRYIPENSKLLNTFFADTHNLLYFIEVLNQVLHS